MTLRYAPFELALWDEHLWEAGLDEAVNKRFLSTGETGEFAGENVGFGLNPGG